MMIKTYQELITFPTFAERFKYLKLDGIVGDTTFGHNRYLNQILYRTTEWKNFRKDIMVRDHGCDLACEGYDIIGQIIVHHINPITVDDILNRHPKIFDPNNVITTLLDTHNAIHYGNEEILSLGPMERSPNDTCPWKK